MELASVSAVLFAKDLQKVAAFYSNAIGMQVLASDEYHSRLACRGFELTIHQIPRHIADSIDDAPPDWAERSANFFLGYDPEGNQFGVGERR